MYPLVVRALAPVLALAAAAMMQFTPPPETPMQVQVLEVKETAKGVAIKGKVTKQEKPDLDFEAIIDRLTKQPGQLTRITIRNHSGQVTAEYWHPAPAKPSSELANTPTDMQALRTVYRWYRAQPKTGDWFRSLIRGRTNEHPS